MWQVWDGVHCVMRAWVGSDAKDEESMSGPRDDEPCARTGGSEMEQHMYVKTTSDGEPPGTTAKGKGRTRRENNDEEAERKHDTSTVTASKRAGQEHGLYRLSHRGTACG